MKSASVCVVFLSFWIAAPASADVETGALEGEARVHYDLGVAAYAARDYEIAILEFRSAYHIDPRPELLFAWAQAERLSGDCPSAVLLYRRFLAAHPDPAQAHAAELPLLRCEQALESRPQEARSETPRARPSSPPVPLARVPRRRAWYRDPLGGALAGAGVVSAGIGVGYALSALASATASKDAYTYDESRSLADQARGQRVTAGILLGLGSALCVAAVVRYVVVAGRELPPRVGVALSVGERETTLFVVGSY
jgi:tetratricopeptide (TPR) repeat protein